MSKAIREVPPDTRRIVEGLRDTGYTFTAAIADIVDNSIAADAKHVAIFVGHDVDSNEIVTVADDGTGMDVARLEEAMRYGAPEQPTRNSLSRFGLGLKTASTAFCRRLTVISAPSIPGDVVAATWDLDELARTGTWQLEIGDADADEKSFFAEGLAELDSEVEASHGTVVVWQKIDKLLKTKSGDEAKNKDLALRKSTVALRKHLAMVFQRFLDVDDDRAPNVAISINGEDLEPWDPFGTYMGLAPELDKELAVEAEDGQKYTIRLRAFILPRKEEIESDADREKAQISLELQGIYLYRENRMIEGPDWLLTGATETHLNNLRVELSFLGQLDEIFGVGIRKSGVHLDPNLIDHLKQLLAPVRREADKRSRRGNASRASQTNATSKTPTEITIGRIKSNLTTASVEDNQDGSVVLRNRSGDVPLVDSSGRPSGVLTIVQDDASSELNVVTVESLVDGVLWEPSLNHNVIQVRLNAGHDWYQKAYIPNTGNSPLEQAIEYLFYALAQAEANNTDTDMDEVFKEFRVEVSRNLRKLVKDLPDPDAV